LDAVTDTSDLLAGPLEDRHREHGATFAPFGGWLMPVAYAGTVGEHTATRESVGLFDVSHLGKALVSGPGAAEFVNSTLTMQQVTGPNGKPKMQMYLDEIPVLRCDSILNTESLVS
jgi:glycine cleavage system aminomethyltransferase T